MPVNFNFITPIPPEQGAVIDIAFGAAGPAEVSINVITRPPAANVLIASGEQLQLAVTTPAPLADITGFFDNAVARGPGAQYRGNYTDADKGNSQTGGLFGDADKQARLQNSVWTDAARLSSVTAGQDSDLSRATRPTTVGRYTDGAGVAAGPAGSFTDLDRSQRPVKSGSFTDGQKRNNGPRVSFKDLFRTQRPLTVVPYQDATGRVQCWHDRFTLGEALVRAWCDSFTDARGQTGRGGPLPIPPPPPPEFDPCYIPPEVGEAVLLDFLQPVTPITGGPVPLVFFCEGKAPDPTVPIQQVYFVSNTATLLRAADQVEIPVLSMTVATDADSWAWNVRTEIPGSALNIVQPLTDGTPRVLEANMNGYSWLFLAEDISRGRSFNSDRLQVSGRSLTAELAAPIAEIEDRTNTQDRTAQQIANEVLTVNGQPFGWTIDWQLVDWLVTAGAWAHEGTYIEALLDIVGGVSAVVQSHPTDRQLIIQPRYPVLPWNWDTATPVATLPESVVTVESTRWQEKPRYDRAYVMGRNQGILADIRRDGTSGSNAAPEVVHPLITAVEAARQRGETIFADTGRQAAVTLSMPLDINQGLPLFVPGQLLELSGIDSYRGLVRGVSVTMNRPRLRQNVTIERQYQ